MKTLTINEMQVISGGSLESAACNIGIGTSTTMIAWGVGLAFPGIGLAVGIAFIVGTHYLCTLVD